MMSEEIHRHDKGHCAGLGEGGNAMGPGCPPLHTLKDRVRSRKVPPSHPAYLPFIGSPAIVTVILSIIQKYRITSCPPLYGTVLGGILTLLPFWITFSNKQSKPFWVFIKNESTVRRSTIRW